MTASLLRKTERFAYQASILIPMYNEENSILFILNKVKTALSHFRYEIIVIDDGSTDQSAQEVKKFMSLNPQITIKYLHQNNQGKGGAVRTGLQQAEGEIIVIQDADLEYEPSDIPSLLALFTNGAQVVYGSRNMVKGKREHSSVFFYWGGLVVTFFTNLLFGSKLTDEATGYKLFHAQVLENLSFKNNDFAWEPELTAKILKQKIEIVESPVSYHPRSIDEGKKISWKDGVKAIWVLIKERLTND